jgi:hypothetical protein
MRSISLVFSARGETAPILRQVAAYTAVLLQWVAAKFRKGDSLILRISGMKHLPTRNSLHHRPTGRLEYPGAVLVAVQLFVAWRKKVCGLDIHVTGRGCQTNAQGRLALIPGKR